MKHSISLNWLIIWWLLCIGRPDVLDGIIAVLQALALHLTP